MAQASYEITMVQREIRLAGRVPSKKNSKMILQARGRMKRPMLITKPEYQMELTTLTLQARKAWGRQRPLTSVTLWLVFHVSSRAQDLDNACSGLLDVLKDAGVIVDDSMMHVMGIHASYKRVTKGHEGVDIEVVGQEEQEKKAA